MREEESEAFFITPEEEGERLDKILAQRFKQAGSRTYFQFLIEEGRVLVNGSPVKKRLQPKSGDEVEVEYILTPELTLKPEKIPLSIVYEDEEILVVNKEVGMVVHPAPGHWSGTFVNALLFHCQNELLQPVLNVSNSPSSLRPGIVHRLDKDTSGLLIAAKTAIAQQRLIEMFIARSIYKEYLAICVGNPGQGTIEAPIGRHPTQRKMMAVLPDGRKAITHYETISFNSKISLVRLILATGRTHQIRVHMRHHGTPILGDDLYGSESFNQKYQVDRQMLHASRLRFNHPLSGKTLELSAEAPQDMQKLMRLIA